MFKEVVFQTNKLKALQRFYANVLELDITEQTENAFTVKIGTTNLIFRQSEEKASYHFAVNIPGNQFVIMKHWIQDRLTLNKTAGLNEIYYESFDADSMYFEDPAGNLIELIGRRNCDLFGSLTKDAFFDISEVALVTSDVAQIGEELQDFGVPLRHGSEIDPKGVNFLGKDDAFIVLAPTKWNWYFADKKSKAQTYPVEITLDDERRIVLHAEGSIELHDKEAQGK